MDNVLIYGANYIAEPPVPAEFGTVLKGSRIPLIHSFQLTSTRAWQRYGATTRCSRATIRLFFILFHQKALAHSEAGDRNYSPLLQYAKKRSGKAYQGTEFVTEKPIRMLHARVDAGARFVLQVCGNSWWWCSAQQDDHLEEARHRNEVSEGDNLLSTSFSPSRSYVRYCR